MSFTAASTMGKALVGVPVTQTKSFRQMRAAPAGRRSTKVVAMAGAETAVVVAARWALAVPTMYAVVSFNEYVTHRWFQHAEFNKTDWMKALWCKVTGEGGAQGRRRRPHRAPRRDPRRHVPQDRPQVAEV
jgi:hypothetical protein